MKLVKSIRKHGHIRVYNALLIEGYEWRDPKHRPGTLILCLRGIPLVVLVRVLARLEAPSKRAYWR